ncbi:MAG: hypothetical protein M0C28_13040 [Candidatus Moduliflexus flocculans]|nr:hypothetical protein [Candidatus Moduliflexus flocculans]
MANPFDPGPLHLPQRRPGRPRPEEAHRRGSLRRGHRHRPRRDPRPGHQLHASRSGSTSGSSPCPARASPRPSASRPSTT